MFERCNNVVSQLSWKGDIEGLKDFTRNVLKMTGRWKSVEVKAFYSSHEELIFKWQGLKRKKIEIVKDRNNELLKNLKSHACDENEVNNGKIFNDHVLYEAMSLPLPSRTCSECGVDESHPDHTVRFLVVLVNLKRKRLMKRKRSQC